MTLVGPELPGTNFTIKLVGPNHIRSRGQNSSFKPADTTVARETLCKLLERLPLTLDWPAKVAVVDRDQRHIPIEDLPALNSTVDLARDEIDRLASSLLGSARGSDGNAVLVVGHQPTLSRIADALLNDGRPRLLRRAPTPLDRSGIVCVAVADE
jgi:hypothetical protein